MRSASSPRTSAEDGGLGGVADRRARGVGVDVVDLAGLDLRVGQGLAHGGGGRGGVGAGDHVVVGVAAGPAAGDLGIGVRRPAAGVGGPLQHERHAPLAQHEPVAAAVERARRGGRVGVPPRQRPQVAERRQADRRDGQVAGPRHADVDQAEPKPVAADLERVVAAGAGGRERQRRPGEPQLALDPLDRRIAVLVRVVEPRAAREMVGLPEQHPLGARCPSTRPTRASRCHPQRPASRRADSTHQWAS